MADGDGLDRQTLGDRAYAKLIADQQRQLDGAPLRSRANSDAYREGWERTFGNKHDSEEKAP